MKRQPARFNPTHFQSHVFPGKACGRLRGRAFATTAALTLTWLLLPAGPAAAGTNKYWNPAISGAATDGPGTWSTALNNWSTATSGGTNGVWVNANNDIAVIGAGGVADTITLGTGITVGGLTFNTTASGNYLITGNTLTFAGGTATTGIVANQPAAISSTLASSATPLVFTKGLVTLSGTGASMAAVAQGFNVGPVITAANAAASITGGTNTFGELLVGRGNLYSGALYVSGGTTTFGGGGGSGVGVGSGAAVNAEPNANGTSFGYMEVSGGTVNNIEWNIGNRDKGVMYVSGSGIVNNTSWNTRVGNRNGGTGVLDIYTGGTWNQNNPTNGGNAVEIAPANSVLNVRGGTLNIQVNKNISINNAAATLNVMNGGLIQNVPNIDGSGMLNFNNGTVQARADNTTFLMNSGGSINVYPGGATIDTQSYNVGINKNILAPPGSGVTGLTTAFTALTNMVAAPMVVITGGGGSGATAIANFNSSTGTVSGITITNPGINYTSSPTVTLYAGGGALATTYLGSTGANASGDLIKTGSGSLTLSGANTYTGETRVKAGKLRIGGTQTATSGITLSNGTILDVTSSLTVKTLTTGELATDTMQLNLVAGTTSNTITVNNAAGINTVANPGQVLLSVGNGGGWVVGTTYPLITYNGGYTGTGSTAFALTSSSLAFGHLADSGTQLGYVVDSLPGGGPYLWTGATDGNMDFSTLNWKDSGGYPTLYANSGTNAVTFDDTASNFNVLLAGTMTPASVAVNNPNNAYTIGGLGKLSGSMALTKSGNATLTLSSINDYSGGTILNGGTLKLGAATALLNTGAVTFGGGTLDINGLSPTVGTIAGTSGSIINSSATAGTLTVNQTTGTQSYAGTVNRGANSLSLTKNGAGKLVVSSASNTITTLTVSAGQLLLDNSVAASPSATLANMTSVSGTPALLDIKNAAVTTPGINIVNGQVIVEGTSTITSTGGNIQGNGDSNSKSYFFKDFANIVATGRDLQTSYTQAAQSYYIVMQDDAQANFANVGLIQAGNYTDGVHSTLLEIKDRAKLTTSANMYVMKQASDSNRTNNPLWDFAQVYQHGGTVTVGGTLYMTDNDTALGTGVTAPHETSGSYILGSGSSLKVTGRILGGSTRTGYGQSFFNFHGGTLTYTGSGAQTDWINLTVTAGTAGTTSVNNLRVWEGGTIDTGSQNVTIAQALLGPTGSGVSAIATTGLTATQYLNGCPPWVYISGGGGSGASAVATLDANGYINGINITNPGNDYTSTPTVKLMRGGAGGNVTVSAANVSLAANSNTGGLTKQGSGTLTLTSGNTYAGTTTVQAGTLALSGSGTLNAASNISIAAGGTFDVSPLGASATYNLGGGATLIGSGTGLTVGTTAATIKAGASGTFNVGSQPITLNFDGSNPPLYVSQGTLSLGGSNAFTVNGSPLGYGYYTLIQQASGTIASGGSSYTVSGTALGSAAGVIHVSGNQVTLEIHPATDYLAVTSVNGGSSPQAGVGFSVVVQSFNSDGTPKIMGSDTPVSLSLATGTGTLGGTTSGTISGGTSSTTISGVTYTKAETGVSLVASGLPSAIKSAAFAVNPGPAATIAMTSGDGQAGSTMTALTNPFVVTVTDSYGNPVPGTSVTFAIATTPAWSVGQSLSVTGTTTAANGQGSSILTLGNGAGTYTVTASALGLSGSPVTFTATATPPPPIYKADTGTDLAAGVSWTGGSVPNSSQAASWISTSLGAGLTLAVPESWAAINVADAQTDIDISGAGTITLGNNGIDMSASAKNLTIANPVALGANQAWIVNSGMTLTASGAISGASYGLTKAGAGTLALNTANTYGGGTFVNDGTLKLGSASALLSTGAVTIGGGTLDLNGFSPTVGSITGTAGSIINSSGTSSTLTVNQTTGTISFSGLINRGANTLNLTKQGAGTAVISSSDNTLSTLNISGGQLTLDNSVAASPTMTNSAAIAMSSGTQFLINNATITMQNGINIVGGLVVADGTSTLNVSGAGVLGNADGVSKSYQFKGSSVVNSSTAPLWTSHTQANSQTYLLFQNNTQATFANIGLVYAGEYADGYSHRTVMEVKDGAAVTTAGTGNLWVMRQYNDQNRTGTGYGLAQVYQHGGTVTVGGNLSMAENDVAVGTGGAVHVVAGSYNLWTGGTLNLAGRVLGGATRTGYGQAFFGFHGGTLVYTGATNQTDWINLTVTAGTAGTTSANNLRMWEGGAIDTGSRNLTINQAILAPTGQGISAISTTGLTSTVYNNGCPPWVYITGGGGSGATAVATLNSSGNITGFVITNPGCDYTSTPTIILGRPGAAEQTVPAGNITLSANSAYAGGLTKQGVGTLTLTNSNTYVGDTTVQAGTLLVNNGSGSGTGAGNVTVQSAAAIGGSGSVAGVVTVEEGGKLAANITNWAANTCGNLTVALLNLPATWSVVVTADASFAEESKTFQFMTATGGITGYTVPTVSGPGVGTWSARRNAADDRILEVVYDATVSNPYVAWAGAGVAFDADANNDGVANGLAWILGATDPSANSNGLLPTPTSAAGVLTLEFTCLKPSGMGSATLYVQYSNDLGALDAWASHSAAVPDLPGTPGDPQTVNGVVFHVTEADSTHNHVLADIPLSAAADGKLFGRLRAVEP